MTVDLGTVIAAFLGAFAAPFVNSFLNGRREKQSRGREAKYLAIGVAVILEEFSSHCAEYVSDQDIYSKSEGSFGTAHGTLPDLKPYPEGANWKVFDLNLLGRVLSFPNELKYSQRLISWFGENCDYPATQECYRECGRCGYVAWKLAKDIRQEYGFPAIDETYTRADISSILKPVYDECLLKAKEQASPKLAKKAA